jgi:hypothetical protein
MSPRASISATFVVSAELLIDSNLLLLLIMGSFNSSLIGSFKRLAMFTGKDFSFLQLLVARCKAIIVTPHILTEVGNLANSLSQRQKEEWSIYFREWIVKALEERQIRAVEIAASDAFLYFGITDAAIFHASTEVSVLTVDARLAAYLQTYNRSVINFNHLRQSWLFP